MGCEKSPKNRQNVGRDLRLDLQANDSMMRLAAPKSQLSEVNIKGDYRKPSSIREAQYILIVTTIEVRIAGVYHLVAVLL
jgi:hypothetical protein